MSTDYYWITLISMVLLSVMSSCLLYFLRQSFGDHSIRKFYILHKEMAIIKGVCMGTFRILNIYQLYR